MLSIESPLHSHDRLCLPLHLWLRYDMGTVCSFHSNFHLDSRPDHPSRGVWILTGETFPTRTRSYQASLAAGSNWLWNFLLAFFTPFITKAIGFRYGFVFAGKL